MPIIPSLKPFSITKSHAVASPTFTPSIESLSTSLATPCSNEAGTGGTIPTHHAGHGQKDKSKIDIVRNASSQSSQLRPLARTAASVTISTTDSWSVTSKASPGSIDFTPTASASSTLSILTSPASGGTIPEASSSNSADQQTILLGIIFPIILLLIILFACCFYRRRRMVRNDETKPSSAPIQPPVAPVVTAAAIGISRSRKSASTFSNTSQSDHPSQFSLSTSSKEMLPREPPSAVSAANLTAQSRHSSHQSLSLYSLYARNSNFADPLMADEVMEENAARDSYYSSASSSPSSSYKSQKSVLERRNVDQDDYVTNNAFYRASLVPSANSFATMNPDLDSQPDTKCDETSPIASSELSSERSHHLPRQVPVAFAASSRLLFQESEEKDDKGITDSKDPKAAFPIELKETARGRFELALHPRWMREPQFVNPNAAPDFSSSIDGAHNELDEEDFDLDDYVPPAPTSHVAIMNYSPKRKEEMLIANGDLIGIERQLSGEWCLGQNISQQRKRGLFPLSAVVAIKSGPSQAVRRGRFGAALG